MEAKKLVAQVEWAEQRFKEKEAAYKDEIERLRTLVNSQQDELYRQLKMVRDKSAEIEALTVRIKELHKLVSAMESAANEDFRLRYAPPTTTTGDRALDLKE